MDPEKVRAWQQRSKPLTPRYVDREPQTKSKKRKSTVKPRRNDAPWRREVEALRGLFCRACWANSGGRTRNAGPLQCDHVWPRGQGGPSVVENGTMLCRIHHEEKTNGQIQYERSWLDPDQVAWLADVGWVAWDADGQPYGRGYKHFAPIVGAGRVEEHGNR